MVFYVFLEIFPQKKKTYTTPFNEITTVTTKPPDRTLDDQLNTSGCFQK